MLIPHPIWAKCRSGKYERSVRKLGMQLRQATRYQSSSPTFYRWDSSEGQPHQGEGMTLDISTQGVFIRAIACPPVGTHIELEVWLPKLHKGSPGILLYGEGQVLRVGAALERLDLRRWCTFRRSDLKRKSYRVLLDQAA
jgi:hypothetical protein